jgi:hypothetical protein
VLLLVVIGVLLYFKQKPYTIFAIIFLGVIIVTNVALFLGPHNAFLASFPLLFFIFTSMGLSPLIFLFGTGFFILLLFLRERGCGREPENKLIARLLVALVVLVVIGVVMFWSYGK